MPNWDNPSSSTILEINSFNRHEYEKNAVKLSCPQKLDSTTNNWGADFLWTNTTQQNLNYRLFTYLKRKNEYQRSCTFLQYSFQCLSWNVVKTVWKKWHKRTYSPQTIRATAYETEICQMLPPPKTEEDRLRLRILQLEVEVAYLKELGSKYSDSKCGRKSARNSPPTEAQ